jgi:phage-related protein
MGKQGRPLVWLQGEIKTPPFTVAARLEAGALLRLVQDGVRLGLPHARPMPSIGARCYELRVQDETATWRIVYRADQDAVVIVEVFSKKSQQTPKHIVEVCKDRLKRYDAATS